MAFIHRASATPSVAERAGRWRTFLPALQDTALLLLFALFVTSHGRAMLEGRFTSVPFAVENGLLFCIYLSRRRSIATSSRFGDWAWAAGGGWLPFAMRVGQDAPPVAEAAGVAVQMLGLSLTITSMGFLGRSFGIVAANRGLKTGGAYGLVRHPIYAAHAITATGMILANPSWMNVMLLVVVLICQVKRMDAEERVLLETSGYADYMERVRYRLIPGLY